MTEGIIQEVFEKLKNEIPMGWNIMVINAIDRSEKELIEKIKRDIQTSWIEFDCDSRTARKILQSLIGDNQK